MIPDRTHVASVLKCVVSAAILSASVPETGAAQEKVTLGLGVSFNPAAVAADKDSRFQSAGLADYYLTAQIGDILRAEFQFGLLVRSQDQTYNDSTGEFNGHTSGVILQFGFGAFYTWRPDSTFTLYAGPRTGILASTEYTSYSRPSAGYADQKTIWAAFFISACLGAECALSRHLSLGGEFQLTSTGFGVPNQIPAATGYPRDFKQNVYSTDALIFVRFFF
jgi:hypothetical protein